MIPATAELHNAGFAGLLRFYREHLTGHVMPFWVERAIDREHGGITNIITDDGRVTSTEKYLWSQGRALFTFASLYNDFDGDRAWLEQEGDRRLPRPGGPAPAVRQRLRRDRLYVKRAQDPKIYGIDTRDVQRFMDVARRST